MAFIKNTTMRELKDLAEAYRIPGMFKNKSQEYLNQIAERLDLFLQQP